jgi:hypothetical protein
MLISADSTMKLASSGIEPSGAVAATSRIPAHAPGNLALPTAVLEPAQALRRSSHEQVGERTPEEGAGPYGHLLSGLPGRRRADPPLEPRPVGLVPALGDDGRHQRPAGRR